MTALKPASPRLASLVARLGHDRPTRQTDRRTVDSVAVVDNDERRDTVSAVSPPHDMQTTPIRHK